MEQYIQSPEESRIEQALSRIGAEIADANDLARQSKEFAARSEARLILAQRETEALYLSLDGNTGQALR